MAQELLYTSAPRGLKPGSRGFCTVEATAGMSPALVTVLEGLSAYRHVAPPGDSANPVVSSHVTLSLGGRTFSVLSRVADAGTDYTGRTNKLAHHVVLEAAERPVGGPAWLLGKPEVMRTSFAGDPRTPPPRRLPSGDRPPAACAAWKAATGDAGWAGVLAEALLADATRPAYLVTPPGLDVRPLFEEAIALLPPDRRWSATFTTGLTTLPANVTCVWRAVLAGSKEANDSRRQVQALRLDLTAPLGPATGGPLVAAARTGRVPAAPAASRPAASTAAVPQSAAAGPLADPLDEMPLTAAPPRPTRFVDALGPPPDLPTPRRRTGLWIGLGTAALLLTAAAGVGVWYVAQHAPPRGTEGRVATNDARPPVDTPSAVAASSAAAHDTTTTPAVAADDSKATNGDTRVTDAHSDQPTMASAASTTHDQMASAGGSGEPTNGDSPAAGPPVDGPPLAPTASPAVPADPQQAAPAQVVAKEERPALGRVSIGEVDKIKRKGSKTKLYRFDGLDRNSAPGIDKDRKDTFRLWLPKWSGDRYTVEMQGTNILRFQLPNRQSATISVSTQQAGPGLPETRLWLEATTMPDELWEAIHWSVLTVESGERTEDVRRYLLSPVSAEIPSEERRIGRKWALPSETPVENGVRVKPELVVKTFVIKFEGAEYSFLVDGDKLVSSALADSIVRLQSDTSVKRKVNAHPPAIKWSVDGQNVTFAAVPAGGYRAVTDALKSDAEVQGAKKDFADSSPEKKTFGDAKLGWAALFGQFDDPNMTRALAEQMREWIIKHFDDKSAQAVQAMEAAEAPKQNRDDRKSRLDEARKRIAAQTERIVSTLGQREAFEDAEVVAAQVTYPVVTDDGEEWSVDLIKFDTRAP